MNGELIDSAWRVLPNEFKEEVKKRYKGCLFTANRYAKVEADLLEEFFGINNLTSDAEGEEDEMLYVSRKQVQEIYSQNQKEIHRECVSSSDKDCYETVNEVLKTLFGSKCLPDEKQSAKSAHCSEPKPSEPKYHIGQRVRHIPTRLVDVIDGISQAAPYIYHFKHMVDPINGQGIFESDLEPYTEPEASACTDDCPSQYKSQNFDNILKNSFSKERRLNVAAMAMQGILANSHQEMVDMKIDQVVKLAIEVTDALLVEVEEGGTQ